MVRNTKRSLLNNKKGSIEDFITIIVTLLTISVIVLIVAKISDGFNTEIQANSDLPAKPKEISAKMDGLYSGVIDNSFLVIGSSFSPIDSFCLCPGVPKLWFYCRCIFSKPSGCNSFLPV